jgi:dienelactone hydrolase
MSSTHHLQSLTAPLIVTSLGKKLTCNVAYPKTIPKGKSPMILFFPDVMGNKIFDQCRATVLARELGAAVVVVDLYGSALPPSERENRGTSLHKAFDTMNSVLADPVTLRRNIKDILESALVQINGDPKRVAAIGFCFGGGCVMHLARAHLPVQGIVSFHGSLDAKPMKTLTGKEPPPIISTPHDNIDPKLKILICHGNSDPLVPKSTIDGFMEEMKKFKVENWTLESYGNTSHAFTMPNNPTDPPNPITRFQPNAARRSWASAIDFLRECLHLEQSPPSLVYSTLTVNDFSWINKL